jgi:hypothetical protein
MHLVILDAAGGALIRRPCLFGRQSLNALSGSSRLPRPSPFATKLQPPTSGARGGIESIAQAAINISSVSEIPSNWGKAPGVDGVFDLDESAFPIGVFAATSRLIRGRARAAGRDELELPSRSLRRIEEVG